MKVVFIITIDLSKPGPSVHLLLDIIKKVALRENKVVVIWKGLPSSIIEISLNNVEFIKIEDDAVPKNKFIQRYFDAIRYSRKIKPVLKKIGSVDSVFIQSNNTILSFVNAVESVYKGHTKIIYNAQDLFPDNLALTKSMKKYHFAIPVFRYLQKKGYQKVDSIITISEDMKDTIMNYGIPKEKILVAHNWCYEDSVVANNCNFELPWKISSDCFDIVYTGNIGKVQNVEILLEIAKHFRENKEFRFIIIGKGNSLKSLKDRSFIDNLDNVEFYDWVPAEFASCVYANADINFIPLLPGVISTCLPSKTAVCLASGKPIIALFGDSKIGTILNNYKGCYSVDANVDVICDLIKKIYDEQVLSDGCSCFEKYFRRDVNTEIYCNEIVGRGN